MFYFSIQSCCWRKWRLKRWQNLTNQPLEALKELVLLIQTASFLIYFSSVSSLFLILSQMTCSIQLSVGRPPPSFLSQPFFFHLSKLRRGIPNSFEIILTSSPAMICIMLDVPFPRPAFSSRKCICGKGLWFCGRSGSQIPIRLIGCSWFRKGGRERKSWPGLACTCRRWSRGPGRSQSLTCWRCL